jgi:hypothetical protein
MIVANGVTTSRTEELPEPDVSHSWWMPRWLQRERQVRVLERWAAELGWQWSEAADVADLARHTVTPAKYPVTVAPTVHSVDMGPPVTLLVRMLPGQIADDFQAQEERLATALGVSAVHIEPYDPGWIRVTLLDHES